jgi:hypothetical protein
MVMLHGHHAAARTARGSDQDAWVISGKQGWVSSRERRRTDETIPHFLKSSGPLVVLPRRHEEAAQMAFWEAGH